MAVATPTALLLSAAFTPRDNRDPLGVFGFVGLATGDASGATVEVQMIIEESVLRSNVLMPMAVGMESTSISTVGTILWGMRWPEVGHASRFPKPVQLGGLVSDGSGATHLDTDQQVSTVLLTTNLAGAPGGTVVIAQFRWTTNTDLADYRADCWGYYWDKRSLLVPGSLRMPFL